MTQLDKERLILKEEKRRQKYYERAFDRLGMPTFREFVEQYMRLVRMLIAKEFPTLETLYGPIPKYNPD